MRDYIRSLDPENARRVAKRKAKRKSNEAKVIPFRQRKKPKKPFNPTREWILRNTDWLNEETRRRKK